MRQIPTMCLNCSTVCGMIAKVKDGRILKLEGNPKDPNSEGKLCAKGQAAINMVEDPDRILYPQRRVGPRGSGKWERISWKEAIDEVSARLRNLRKEGRPEELVALYGRDRTNGFLERFTDAFGTPHRLGHRGLCSLNKRMAIRASIGDADWDTPDLEHTRFVLNFGSNFYEAHQGHIGMLRRAARAKRKGAKFITFDVRLSHTAAQSDQWLPIFPGTDGLVALAMGHVILRHNLQDTQFVEQWTNGSLKEWRDHYLPYTPQWAERESGVPAETIVSLAREFANHAPSAVAITNRGAHAHENGFHNEWAILCLNALVGNLGKKGGLCWISGDVNRVVPQPGPMPPKPKARTELSHPSPYPFVNQLYPKAVSSSIFPYIDKGIARINTLFSYYVNAPMSWPEGPTAVRDILMDERKIPFHVVVDAFYSEMAETADILLPDATFLEKWDLDARNSFELQPYVGLRQPVVRPPGECQDIRDTLIQLAKAIDEEMASYFPFEDAQDFVRKWAAPIPGGLERLKHEGIWINKNGLPSYQPYLTEIDYDVSDPRISIDEKGRARWNGSDDELIGMMSGGKIVKGFETEDRKFQFKLRVPDETGNVSILSPTYAPISVHQNLKETEYVLTTFKWNVHTQSRTANQVWLTEIVNHNPCWIHPETAKKHRISSGESFRVVSDTGELIVDAFLTEAIHPRVLAISASFGHWRYGKNAQGKGHNPNVLIPDWTDPIGGGQAWNDTVIKMAPLEQG